MKKDDLNLWLEKLAQQAQTDFESENTVRDQALYKSRELIRLCSQAIRAGHRNAWDNAHTLLAQANEVAQDLQTVLPSHPKLYYAGYTQDALKEWVEAHLTLAFLCDSMPPEPNSLDVPYSTYLNGLCEAASELRRRCLDVMRQEDMQEAERLLESMDAVYDVLMAFNQPNAVTGGLRRRVDQLRGVLERTRGDLTNSLQIQKFIDKIQLEEV